MRNLKKRNDRQDTIDKFTDENRMVSFGAIKRFIIGKYKWAASFIFKNKNNIATNKHKAYIGWFSDVEANLNQYGNVEAIQAYPYFSSEERAKLPRFYTELSSRQYRNVGQEYAEYDQITKVDLSDKISIDFDDIGTENRFDIYHAYGDIPAFVTAGYKIPGKYLRINQHVKTDIKFNKTEIYLNDARTDILSHPEVIDYIDSLTVPTNNKWIGSGELIFTPIISEGEGADETV